MKVKKISLLMFLMLFGLILTKTIFAAPGDLDPSFGQNGIVNTIIGNYSDFAYDVAVQPDGKIVAVGVMQVYNSVPTPRAAIARYNPNGTLDASFGNGGTIGHLNFGLNSGYTSVVIQPDGKILAAGGVLPGTGGADYNFLVVRYNTNGTLDNSFGSVGVVATEFRPGSIDSINQILLQPDGKILIIGCEQGAYPDKNFAILRYNADGSLDTTFDGDGKVSTSFSQPAEGFKTVLQSDGKIVVAGTVFDGTIRRFALARYNLNGSLDTNFGDGGKLVADTGSGTSSVAAVTLQSNGKITVIGSNNNSSGTSDAVLIRYNSNGSPDQTFGSNGIVRTDINNFSNGAYDAFVQPDDKITVLGWISGSSLGSTTLARYNSNGTLDTSFGQGGIVQHPNISHKAIAFQPDGKIITAGDTASFPLKFSVARYFNNAPPNRRFDFDGDGKSDVSVFRPSSGAWFLNQSQNGFAGIQFGFGTDKIVPADYDGDGKTDVAVYRPANGTWYLNRSQAGFTGVQFGAAEDFPVPADYDGDGKADVAVFRPSNGTWYIQRSQFGFTGFQFGANGDKPVAADYDGDGKADIGVYRNGVWYLERSRDHFISYQLGIGTDRPVPADYDGDGKTDIAVYRPSNGVWYVERSRDHFAFYQFGTTTDVPTPADYDGDGKADLAVFRPANGVWYLNRSQSGLIGIQFGATEDRPAPSAFVP